MVTTVSLLPKKGAVSDEEIEAWVIHWSENYKDKELDQLKAAIALIQEKYNDLEANDGNSCVFNLLQTADILAHLKMDAATITAALLMDLPLENSYKEKDYSNSIDNDVLQLIDNTTRIRKVSIEIRSSTDEQDENFRRMLLSFSSDVRVILLILAKRLQRMRFLSAAPLEEQLAIANETRRIHAPLANRLGVWQIKWELEDLALRFGKEKEYREIVDCLEEKRQEREDFIAAVIARLEKSCDALNIQTELTGRPKHIYSIWRKMHRKGVRFDQVFDVRAVRVLVDSIPQCYEVLGIVHGLWQPIPGEFDDYISRPKSNGYASLHTAVVGKDAKPLEIQIRTFEMHEHSERGVAAHWRYKEASGQDADLERHIEWMRDWLEHKALDEGHDSEDVDFVAKKIYVLTPAGKVIELPVGATAIDFAYAVHTSVGHRCRGAKVDNQIIPLTKALKSGQIVEVMTTKEGGPSRDWLNTHAGYIATSRARERIRHWFKKQDVDQHIHIGRVSLDKEIKRLSITKPNLEKLAPLFKFKSTDDLLAAIGRGDLTASHVGHQYASSLKDEATDIDENLSVVDLSKTRKKKSNDKASAISVLGVDDLMTTMANCCKPVPYDAITGYVTIGRGITIHRQGCDVVRRMEEDQRERLLPVAWSDENDHQYLVDIRVYAADRKGLLKDITGVFANNDIPVLGVKTQTDKMRIHADMHFSVEIEGLQQLSYLLEKLQQIPDVIDVTRYL